jgi:hypothetical protein
MEKKIEKNIKQLEKKELKELKENHIDAAINTINFYNKT